jgi:hypothetical protein
VRHVFGCSSLQGDNAQAVSIQQSANSNQQTAFSIQLPKKHKKGKACRRQYKTTVWPILVGFAPR